MRLLRCTTAWHRRTCVVPPALIQVGSHTQIGWLASCLTRYSVASAASAHWAAQGMQSQCMPMHSNSLLLSADSSAADGFCALPQASGSSCRHMHIMYQTAAGAQAGCQLRCACTHVASCCVRGSAEDLAGHVMRGVSAAAATRCVCCSCSCADGCCKLLGACRTCMCCIILSCFLLGRQRASEAARHLRLLFITSADLHCCILGALRTGLQPKLLTSFDAAVSTTACAQLARQTVEAEYHCLCCFL